MIGLHHQERFAKAIHRIATSDWTLALFGLLLPLCGIIWVLENG